jgi:hypothetical protein
VLSTSEEATSVESVCSLQAGSKGTLTHNETNPSQPALFLVGEHATEALQCLPRYVIPPTHPPSPTGCGRSVHARSPLVVALVAAPGKDAGARKRGGGKKKKAVGKRVAAGRSHPRRACRGGPGSPPLAACRPAR